MCCWYVQFPLTNRPLVTSSITIPLSGRGRRSGNSCSDLNETGFEQADKEGFWDSAVRDMRGKVARFNEVWGELGLPYTEPEGGYFVMVNMARVRLPADYPFPAHVA